MRGFMKGQRMSDVGAFEDAHLRMTALENIFKKETEKQSRVKLRITL